MIILKYIYNIGSLSVSLSLVSILYSLSVDLTWEALITNTEEQVSVSHAMPYPWSFSDLWRRRTFWISCRMASVPTARVIFILESQHYAKVSNISFSLFSVGLPHFLLDPSSDDNWLITHCYFCFYKYTKKSYLLLLLDFQFDLSFLFFFFFFFI